MNNNIVNIDEYAIKELESYGFHIDGYDSVASLMNRNLNQVPTAGGVYAVITLDQDMPEFIVWQYGDKYKKKDRKTKEEIIRPLMYSREELEKSWLSETSIVYFGKADNLNERLKTYIRYYDRLKECTQTCEEFNQVAHRGGRSIWQVKGAEDFILVWMKTPNAVPKDVEAKLIQDFKSNHGGCRPFANKKDS